ncbi:MAG: NTP transferase domain-containing protein [Candidatus Levybacteria bacterium]|nr:NTP transferase domain-containing protein [Candidatus Levybacteria bacterium]
MQAVILAAGQSSRLFPFGGTMQKATISLMGKSLVVQTIDSLRRSGVSRITVVISPDNGVKESIEALGEEYRDIRFVSHVGARGMGEALLDTSSEIKEDFLLLHAHHFECDTFIPELVSAKKKLSAQGVLLLRKESSLESYGIVSLTDDQVTSVAEKPKGVSDALRIVGIYLLSPGFLDVLISAEKHHYSFETALDEFAKKERVVGVRTEESVVTLKYPWHILDIGDFLLSRLSGSVSRNAKIAESAVIEGSVFVSEHVTIENGVVIKGPCFIGEGVYIGTNALLRGGVIVEKGAVIGANMEVKHSIIMEGSSTHSGYIGDSVIGKNCKIAALFCSGNVRIDRANVHAVVKDEKTDSKRRSLGVFVGDGTKIGIRVSTMPGVLIGKNVIVGPSTTVFKNVPSDTKYFSKITEVIQEHTDGTIEKSEQREKKVVLFDIDYTLFDTKQFRESDLTKFAVYDEVVEVLGGVSKSKVTKDCYRIAFFYGSCAYSAEER